jgi:hypothetical protein
MREILGRIAAASKDESPFVGDRKVREMRSMMTVAGYVAGLGVDSEWRFHLDLGIAELRLGHEMEAIEQLEAELSVVPKTSDTDLTGKRTHYQLGIAWLRYGETQNCCQRNTSDSCIVPIKGGGIHVKEQGSRNAIEHFQKTLEYPPSSDLGEHLEVDESARWLINIAYMTLGEYPENVPPEYLIAKSVFEPEEAFPVFRNIMPDLGLDTFNLCGGVVVDDFDNDLDLDMVTCTWDVAGQTRVFRNDANGEFTDVTEASGLVGFDGGLNLHQADFDNDGDLDVFIMRGAWLDEDGQHPNSLLRNDGDLKFTDVTFDSGVGEFAFPTKSAAWADFDNDGDLDLYVANETDDVIAPCQLFRNEGNGKFVDIAKQAGVADQVFSMGAVWGDYNADRFPDLFLSLRGDNKLYRNNRDGTFTDVAEELAITDPPSSFATWFWDFDNDGQLDVYVQLGGAYPADRNADALFENPGNGQHSITLMLEGTKSNRCGIGVKHDYRSQKTACRVGFTKMSPVAEVLERIRCDNLSARVLRP